MAEQSGNGGGVFSLPSAEGGGTGVPPGAYDLTFTGAEGVPANLEKGYKAGLKFNFKVTAGEHAGKAVYRTCPLSAGPKTALRQFLAGLMGKEPGPAFDPAPYLNKPYKGFIAQSPQGKGTRVESVFPG